MTFGESVENIAASDRNPIKFGIFIRKTSAKMAEYATKEGVHSTPLDNLRAIACPAPRSEVRSGDARWSHSPTILADLLESHVKRLAKIELNLALNDLSMNDWIVITTDILDAAKALRGAAQASWMPIETAPKDGTQIIGLWWSDNSVGEPPMKHIGICVWAGAWIPHQRKLTHWHSVPDTSSVPSAEGK